MESRSVSWERRPSTWLLCIALFTVSWERFLNLHVGTYNVKIPNLVFALCVVAVLLESLVFAKWFGRVRIPRDRGLWAFAALLAAATAWFGIRSLFADHPMPGILQTGTIVVGSVLPLIAGLLVTTSRKTLRVALDATILGGVFAALFGLYQLLAAMMGWDQLIAYEALGGGVPRISAFSYESGFFGYYMVLVIGAIVARRRLVPQTGQTLLLVTALSLVGVTMLANTRAAYLTLPLLGLLILLSKRRRAPRRRSVIVGSALTVVGIGAILVVPATWSFLIPRLMSILNPNEVSSNRPRLDLYAQTLQIYSDHPWFGIGPGNLYYVAPRYGYTIPGDSPNATIANNVYIQALLDGGPLLLALQIAIAVVFVWMTYRRRIPVTSALASGWLAVALIAFIGTSYFWDIKLWAIAGLALASRTVVTTNEPDTHLSRPVAPDADAHGESHHSSQR